MLSRKFQLLEELVSLSLTTRIAVTFFIMGMSIRLTEKVYCTRTNSIVLCQSPICNTFYLINSVVLKTYSRRTKEGKMLTLAPESYTVEFCMVA